MLVVEDREEPGAKVSSGLPKMLLGDGAFEAALNKIVRSIYISGQCAGIAPQPRDLSFQLFGEIGHRTSAFGEARLYRRRVEANVGMRCNRLIVPTTAEP
jgi:hypothetical protein